MEPLTSKVSSSKYDELVSLTLDKADKIFKIVPYKKPKKIITPEEKLDRYKRTCINFFNKVNGILVEKPTIEETKKRNRQNNANFRELHKTSYNIYMNNLMKENYKNDPVYREKEKERSKLRVHKRSEDKTSYNAYMNNYMKEKYKTGAAFRFKEKERSKLKILKRNEAKLLQSNEIINNP
jgi:hypothetical protein